jgi:hypothetical protein
MTAAEWLDCCRPLRYVCCSTSSESTTLTYNVRCQQSCHAGIAGVTVTGQRSNGACGAGASIGPSLIGAASASITRTVTAAIHDPVRRLMHCNFKRRKPREIEDPAAASAAAMQAQPPQPLVNDHASSVAALYYKYGGSWRCRCADDPLASPCAAHDPRKKSAGVGAPQAASTPRTKCEGIGGGRGAHCWRGDEHQVGSQRSSS